MTRQDIDDIISIICPNDTDFEKAIISPAYLKKELEALAIEQEPCEDEYIKVPKKALKYRTAGMVAYNAEWLKNNFDMERAVICGGRAQQPCEDAISREDALMALTGEWTELTDELIHRFIKRIKNLPPVNPQQKTGYWILTSDDDYEYCTCSECGYQNGENWMIGSQIKFCQECGAKMQEVEE